MSKPKKSSTVAQRRRKLNEAIQILRELGFSGKQANEIAGYTFLALLNLEPNQSWSQASDPLRGITPIIDFIADAYGVRYAPNTRETVRDEAVKYFVESGLVIRNPDHPARPTNSGNTAYKIEKHALELLQTFGDAKWKSTFQEYQRGLEHIRAELQRARQTARIPVKLPSGEIVTISPGGQNPLIRLIVEEFCPRFLKEGVVVYIGDSENKFLHLETQYLEQLNVVIPAPAKMPDVVVHDKQRNWLLLIEAVTSAGPVDGKRRKELKDLFTGCNAGLVFVTAFTSRDAMRGFLSQISWESEVWISEDPDHLIHFDGERFLGPYPDVLPG